MSFAYSDLEKILEKNEVVLFDSSVIICDSSEENAMKTLHMHELSEQYSSVHITQDVALEISPKEKRKVLKKLTQLQKYANARRRHFVQYLAQTQRVIGHDLENKEHSVFPDYFRESFKSMYELSDADVNQLECMHNFMTQGIRVALFTRDKGIVQCRNMISRNMQFPPVYFLEAKLPQHIKSRYSPQIRRFYT
jgi:hypothetical protein